MANAADNILLHAIEIGRQLERSDAELKSKGAEIKDRAARLAQINRDIAAAEAKRKKAKAKQVKKVRQSKPTGEQNRKTIDELDQALAAARERHSKGMAIIEEERIKGNAKLDKIAAETEKAHDALDEVLAYIRSRNAVLAHVDSELLRAGITTVKATDADMQRAAQAAGLEITAKRYPNGTPRFVPKKSRKARSAQLAQ